MIEVIVEILEFLMHLGIVLGLAVAAGLTYIISLWLWGEFKVELFVALAVPFAVIGLYLENKIK